MCVTPCHWKSLSSPPAPRVCPSVPSAGRTAAAWLRALMPLAAPAGAAAAPSALIAFKTKSTIGMPTPSAVAFSMKSRRETLPLFSSSYKLQNGPFCSAISGCPPTGTNCSNGSIGIRNGAITGPGKRPDRLYSRLRCRSGELELIDHAVGRVRRSVFGRKEADCRVDPGGEALQKHVTLLARRNRDLADERDVALRNAAVEHTHWIGAFRQLEDHDLVRFGTGVVTVQDDVVVLGDGCVQGRIVHIGNAGDHEIVRLRAVLSLALDQVDAERSGVTLVVGQERFL